MRFEAFDPREHRMEFTPENAPAMTLGFLLTCAVLVAATAGLLLALRNGKRGRVPRILEGMLVVFLIYGIALFASSLASRDRILQPGQQKYFCEIDCHLAYSVMEISTTKTIGDPPNQRTAGGIYYVVKVKTWFDPRTTSPRRGNGPLWPNPRTILAADERGRLYSLCWGGIEARNGVKKQGRPFTQPLRPGESYTTDLVFDLPSDVKDPRLLITENIPFAPFLIGHENSLLHGKIWFWIKPPTARATLKTCPWPTWGCRGVGCRGLQRRSAEVREALFRAAG